MKQDGSAADLRIFWQRQILFLTNGPFARDGVGLTPFGIHSVVPRLTDTITRSIINATGTTVRSESTSLSASTTT